MNVDLKAELKASMQRQIERGERHPLEVPKGKLYRKIRLYPNSRPEVKLPEFRQARARPHRGRRKPCDHCGNVMETKMPAGQRKCTACRIKDAKSSRREAKCDGCGKRMYTERPRGEPVCCIGCEPQPGKRKRIRSAA